MSEHVRWIAGDNRPQWKRRPSSYRMGKRRTRPLLRFGRDAVTGEPCWICVGHRAYGFNKGFPAYVVAYGRTPAIAYERWVINDRRAMRQWTNWGCR